MKKQSEHRKDVRQTCSVPVEGRAGIGFEVTQTTDISKTGMGFVSSKPVRLDKKIAIEIDLYPEDEPALVMGKVKWVHKIPDSKQYRIGVQFKDVLLTGSKQRLKKYFQI